MSWGSSNKRSRNESSSGTAFPAGLMRDYSDIYGFGLTLPQIAAAMPATGSPFFPRGPAGNASDRGFNYNAQKEALTGEIYFDRGNLSAGWRNDRTKKQDIERLAKRSGGKFNPDKFTAADLRAAIKSADLSTRSLAAAEEALLHVTNLGVLKRKAAAAGVDEFGRVLGFQQGRNPFIVNRATNYSGQRQGMPDPNDPYNQQQPWYTGPQQQAGNQSGLPQGDLSGTPTGGYQSAPSGGGADPGMSQITSLTPQQQAVQSRFGNTMFGPNFNPGGGQQSQQQPQPDGTFTPAPENYDPSVPVTPEQEEEITRQNEEAEAARDPRGEGGPPFPTGEGPYRPDPRAPQAWGPPDAAGDLMGGFARTGLGEGPRFLASADHATALAGSGQQAQGFAAQGAEVDDPQMENMLHQEAAQSDNAPGDFQRFQRESFEALYRPIGREMDREHSLERDRMRSMLAGSGMLGSVPHELKDLDQRQLNRKLSALEQASSEASRQTLGHKFTEEMANADREQQMRLANQNWTNQRRIDMGKLFMQASIAEAQFATQASIATADNLTQASVANARQATARAANQAQAYLQAIGMNQTAEANARKDFLGMMQIAEQDLMRMDIHARETTGMMYDIWLRDKSITMAAGRFTSAQSKGGSGSGVAGGGGSSQDMGQILGSIMGTGQQRGKDSWKMIGDLFKEQGEGFVDKWVDPYTGDFSGWGDWKNWLNTPSGGFDTGGSGGDMGSNYGSL